MYGIMLILRQRGENMYRVSLEDDVSHAQIIEELENNACSNRLIKKKEYGRNKIIYTEKDNSLQVVYLEEGHMGTFVNMGGEGQRIIDFHKHGDLIGFDELLLSKQNRRRVYRYSFDKCKVRIIDGEYLLDYLSIRPAFMEFLTKRMSERLYRLSIKEGGKGKYQKDKVIVGLLEAAYKLGAVNTEFYQFPSSINNTILANYCRIDPTSFSKVCKELFDEKFVLNKKKLSIDVQEMRDFLSFSKGYDF